MASSIDGIRRSRYALRVRFGCGFVFGGVVGAWNALDHGASPATVVALAALGGLVSGLLARQLGDRFWYSLHFWR